MNDNTDLGYIEDTAEQLFAAEPAMRIATTMNVTEAAGSERRMCGGMSSESSPSQRRPI